jgi:hypothetical protein
MKRRDPCDPQWIRGKIESAKFYRREDQEELEANAKSTYNIFPAYGPEIIPVHGFKCPNTK